MDEPLHKRTCAPCGGDTPPMPWARAGELLREIPEWELRDSTPMAIARTVKCRDFSSACAWFLRVALLCEREGHHADIRVFGWRNIEFVLSTHAIGGLSENDFIVAAKISCVIDG